MLSYESDLLEYPDLFAGSYVVEGLVQSIVDSAGAELASIVDSGGVVAAVESGYLKSALVASLAARRGRMESGADVVVGVIPAQDAAKLRAAGVARVFTSRDFALTGIVDELVTVVREANGLTTGAPAVAGSVPSRPPPARAMPP